MAKVKYGVIACGAIAQRRHIPEAAANPKSDIVAVCDPLQGRVDEVAEAYGATAYTDYKKLLKHEDMDAVVVCGPNKYHAKQTVDALKAGYHVLCEKPMATTRADAKRMIKTSADTGKYLMIGHNQRLVPLHIKAKELLHSGRLGKVLTFRTCFAHPGPDGWSLDGAKSWFFDKDEAVLGATGDLGVHKADLMRWLLEDEFVEVGGTITALHKKRKGKLIELDDNAYLTLKSKKGAIGSLIASWTNYGRAEGNYTILYCENGVMEIGNDPDYGVIIRYADGGQELYKVGQMASNTSQTSSGVIDSFTDCILKGDAPEINGDEGFAALNIILTAMKASDQGSTLKIKA